MSCCKENTGIAEVEESKMRSKKASRARYTLSINKWVEEKDRREDRERLLKDGESNENKNKKDEKDGESKVDRGKVKNRDRVAAPQKVEKGVSVRGRESITEYNRIISDPQDIKGT